MEQNGAAFLTTRWSVVLHAQGDSSAAAGALGTGHFLERRDFGACGARKADCVPTMVVALKHFLSNERQRAHSIKRRDGEQPIWLDAMLAHERSDRNRCKFTKSAGDHPSHR
jgi:hypothetical protein